jgi:hypothetical protein
LSTLENEGWLPLEAPLEALGDEELDDPPEALGEAALGDEELGDEALDEDELGDDDEELGEEELDAPPEALPEDEDLLSLALGEDEDLLSLALGLELDEAPPLVLCAWATPASANSAAAVAETTTFNNMVNPPRRFGELQRELMQ